MGYSRNLRRSFRGLSVGELIDILSELPNESQVLCCGSEEAHIHVEADKSVVCIDYDSLEDAYPELSDLGQVSLFRPVLA